MKSASFRGFVRGGMVLLEPASPLADGTEVVVTTVVAVPGSPAAVLAALEAAPRVPAEWVDELEQLIAEGRRPSSRLDVFPEDKKRQESA